MKAQSQPPSTGQRVAVVIPCHNAERWLGEAIQSALDQTANVVEVIVVDDGSSDGSLKVAEAFGSRVILLRGAWGNGNCARNHGLAAATGEWVQFLDADDFLIQDKIAGQLAAASDGVDVIYSPLIVRNETTGEESVDRPTPDSDLAEQWLRWELCQTGAALWRIESLRRMGGWKEGLPCCQDNELTLRALMNGLKFQYVDHPGAVYRIWSEETVCRKDPRRVIRQKTQLIDECLAWLKRTGEFDARHRQIAGQACFEMARTLARSSFRGAVIFHSDRKRIGLIRPDGPSAPLSYRFLYHILGFLLTESIACLQRRSVKKLFNTR